MGPDADDPSWQPPPPASRWHPLDPRGYLGATPLSRGYRLVEVGFLLAAVLSAVGLIAAAVGLWGLTETYKAFERGMLASRSLSHLPGAEKLAAANSLGQALEVLGWVDTALIIAGFVVVAMYGLTHKATQPRLGRTAPLAAALFVGLVVATSFPTGGPSFLQQALVVGGNALLYIIVRGVWMVGSFLLLASTVSSRREQSLLTLYGGMVILAGLVGALMASAASASLASDARSGGAGIVALMEPWRIMTPTFVRALLGWIALLIGALGWHLLANRLEVSDPPPVVPTHGLVVLPTPASARPVVRSLTVARGHVAIHVLIALLLVVALVTTGYASSAAKATGGSDAGGPLMEVVDGTLVNVGGAVPEGETHEVELEVNASRVYSLNLTMWWADEPDEPRHTNEPDSFTIEVVTPAGETVSASGTNERGGTGELILNLFDDPRGMPMVGVVIGVNVTLTAAGEQEPDFGPAVFGFRTIADNGNSYDLLLEGTYEQPKAEE